MAACSSGVSSSKCRAKACSICVARGYHEHTEAGFCPRSYSNRPLFLAPLPPPTTSMLFFPCPELTCTVIRLCGVWLGPGFSSQKFSVTWNLGGGPRPWEYLAKSERKGRGLEGKKKEKRDYRQGGYRDKPIPEIAGGCGAT